MARRMSTKIGILMEKNIIMIIMDALKRVIMTELVGLMEMVRAG